MQLDEKWFLQIADDDETRSRLAEIFSLRKKVLAQNSFEGDTARFLLKLGGHFVLFDMRSSLSAIETYQEIFLHRGHRTIDGFDGKDASVVFDIGANRGFYSLAIRESNKTAVIYAFEPNPVEYGFLNEHVKLNSMEPVVVLQCAVEDRAGESWIDYVPEVGTIGGKKMLQTSRPWMKKDFYRRIRVQSVTLDDTVRKYGLERIDILKIDTEGMEAEILGSSTLEFASRVVVEYHCPSVRNELISIMTGKDFELAGEDAGQGRYYGDLYFTRMEKGKE